MPKKRNRAFSPEELQERSLKCPECRKPFKTKVGNSENEKEITCYDCWTKQLSKTKRKRK